MFRNPPDNLVRKMKNINVAILGTLALRALLVTSEVSAEKVESNFSKNIKPEVPSEILVSKDTITQNVDNVLRLATIFWDHAQAERACSLRDTLLQLGYQIQEIDSSLEKHGRLLQKVDFLLSYPKGRMQEIQMEQTDDFPFEVDSLDLETALGVFFTSVSMEREILSRYIEERSQEREKISKKMEVLLEKKEKIQEEKKKIELLLGKF